MMNKTIVVTALAFSLISSAAIAAERATDAALGAVSGAVVLGPIGAVAGAVVGYAAGPSIAHSWGLRRSHSARRHTQWSAPEARASLTESQPGAGNAKGPTSPPPTAAAPAPTLPKISSASSSVGSSAMPPVQPLE